MLVFCITSLGFAQEKVSGTVTDGSNAPIAGVTVQVKGAASSVSTDFDGKYSIVAKKGDELKFSYIGLTTKTVTVSEGTVNVKMEAGEQTLQDVVILGSRSRARTVTESAVPIDVISMKDLATKGAQSNLNQILNMVAPSFTSNTQTVADGTDHIDPAQLRGLGPDQVLVLLNGKRRHTSALVNINGTPGRGSVGTDLNAIPAFAIDKIEVLRDGASAQYGSDAIAGVINLNLKKATGKLDVNVLTGTHMTKGANNHSGGNDGSNVQLDLNYGFGLGKPKSFLNATASFQIRDYTSRAKDYNGTNAFLNGQLYSMYNAVEYRAAQNGVDIGSLFGNITNTPNSNQIVSLIQQYAPQVSYFTPTQQAGIAAATTIPQLQGIMQLSATNPDISDQELAYRGLARKDFNMRVGQSSLESAQAFINAAYPINKNLELYVNSGYSRRTGESAGFYRRPSRAQTYTSLYPNGFLPQINSTIVDFSVSGGLKGKIGNSWNFDLSNTGGSNKFNYFIDNTSNATLRGSSPTSFDAGRLNFSQNTTNFDMNRKFGKLNVAFGAEFRIENFIIRPGEPRSYKQYDISGNPIPSGSTVANIRVTDFYGNLRPAGSQVFPGYRDVNAVDKGRKSSAFYGDLEYDVTSKLLVNGAIRFENYSDFGATTNYKLATLFKVTKNFNLRGAVSTGFRAPSLHQLYFNSTATQFVSGVPLEVATFSNDSDQAQAVGIPKLKQEESRSASLGFTLKIPEANITISTDAYVIAIKDRVVLTDQFNRATGVIVPGSNEEKLNNILIAANATAATFFANAIDTNSRGVDVVISHKCKIGKNASLKTDFAGTFSQTQQVGQIKGSDLLVANKQINKYFSEVSRIYTEEAVPRVKANLTNSLTVGKFDVFLRNVYFGQVTDPNSADINGDGFVNAIVVNGQAVEDEHPIWGAKTITDLSVGYNFTKSLTLVVGANNILDVYPDENPGGINARRASGVDAGGNIIYKPAAEYVDLSNFNQFVYSRNVSQFGQNGRFVFARINFKF